MPTDTVDVPRLTSLYSLLGDRSRVRILFVLESEPLNVVTLCDRLGCAQPAISRHLRLMCQERLIENRREGQYTFYHLEKLGKVALAGLRQMAKHQQ